MKNIQPIPTIIITEKTGIVHKLAALLRRPKQQAPKLHRYRSAMTRQAA